jgi:hypothetical protein
MAMFVPQHTPHHGNMVGKIRLLDGYFRPNGRHDLFLADQGPLAADQKNEYVQRLGWEKNRLSVAKK